VRTGVNNGHFTRQSEHCGLPLGVRYDYQLKVEEMDRWFRWH